MKQVFKITKWLSSYDIHLLPLTILRAFTNSLLPFVEVFWSTKIIQMILDNNLEYTLLSKYLIYMVLSFILKRVIDATLTYIIDVRISNVSLQLNKDVHLKSLSLDFETLERPESLQMVQTAKEAQNAMGGVQAWYRVIQLLIENAFTVVFSVAISINLLVQVTQIPVDSFASFVGSYWGSIVILISITLNLFLQSKFSTKMNSYFLSLTKGNITTNRQSAYLSFLIADNYNFGKVVRLYDMGEMLEDKVEVFHQESKKMYMKWYDKTGNVGFVSQIVNGLLSVPLYIVVIVRAFFGVFPAGQIALYIQALSQLFSGITNIITQYSNIIAMCECFETYISFSELPSYQTTGNLHLEKREDYNFNITFENVSFKYPGSETYALKDVNYTFDLHTKLAIVGTNGAGKTTFIKLLCRLYQPTSGVIKLNGIPIDRYSFKEYVDLLSVVFQDFQLLALPIGDTIASSKRYDKDRILDIIDEVGMGTFLNKHEKGLDTYLYKSNEAGIEVSGGEAQKLAIARALYKDGAYVILDEPTAALDPISEYEIYKNFDSMVKDKTSIYISHRMSSCRFCDHILVMDGGEIIQQGHHDTLVKEDGLYQKMWSAQADYYQ